MTSRRTEIKLWDSGALGAALLLSFVVVTVTGQERCPPDMVWGGEKCEWRDLCEDGTPRRGGRCHGEPIEDEPPPTPPVQRRAPVQPQKPPVKTTVPPPVKPVQPPPEPTVTCPGTHTLVNGRCVPKRAPEFLCSDGKPSINGKCPPIQRICEQSVVFHVSSADPNAARRVLLVGGQLGVLFDRYINEAKTKRRPVDLENLTVYYYDMQGARRSISEKMSLGAFFQGKTLTQVWQRSMRGKIAAQRRDAELQSRSLSSDLVCGDAAQ